MVSRDKIKIIEFGTDDDAPARSDAAEGPAMKILEFEGGPSETKARVTTAKDIGQIKIIEFDDEPKSDRRTESERRVESERRAEPEPRSKPRGPVKIKVFDDERDPIGPATPQSKIKILEFD